MLCRGAREGGGECGHSSLSTILLFDGSTDQCVCEDVYGVNMDEEQCRGIEQLSGELLARIFAFLSPHDLLRCCLICKQWSNVIEATATWDELAQRLCEASSEYSHAERGILKRVGGKRAFIEVESARKRSKTSLHVNVPLEQYAAVTCHVGETAAGKTTLHTLCVEGKLRECDTLPRRAEECVSSISVHAPEVDVKPKNINIVLHDWAYFETDYSRLDALSYFDKNAFWILFAVPDPRSFPDTVSEMLHIWLKDVEERIAFWVNRIYDFDATMIRAKMKAFSEQDHRDFDPSLLERKPRECVRIVSYVEISSHLYQVHDLLRETVCLLPHQPPKKKCHLQ